MKKILKLIIVLINLKSIALHKILKIYTNPLIITNSYNERIEIMSIHFNEIAFAIAQIWLQNIVTMSEAELSKTQFSNAPAPLLQILYDIQNFEIFNQIVYHPNFIGCLCNLIMKNEHKPLIIEWGYNGIKIEFKYTPLTLTKFATLIITQLPL